VIRSGKSVQISVYDLLVGDVCHLEPGDLIPADGIFIGGHNVKCDESSATGESEQMKKVSAQETINQLEAGVGNVHKLDPFIISGAKVLEGVGTYLVTSVGVHSSFGKTMMALREDSTATPLQMKLNDLAEAIAKLGGAAALLLFVVLLIRFLVQLRGNSDPASEKGQTFLRILITAITVVVVAVPEGLPLAVTLALAFATTRMLKDNNLVRVLQACETMGNATTVCSDKTGTLTQNKMTVVSGTIGTSERFGEKVAGAAKGKDAEEQAQDLSMRDFVDSLPQDLKDLLMQSIAQNSTAFEGEEDGKPSFIGSKTETALLSFARDYLGLGSVAEERANAHITQLIPFDSGRKCMGVVVKLENGQYRLMIKGASEILLRRANRIVSPGGAESKMTADAEKTVSQIISTYATRSLRTIGLLYRDFPSWPPPGARTVEDDPNQAEFEDIFDDMIWLGIVGIQDPLRPGVEDAVLQCQKAGVFVRMVTGDNIMTAKAIAEECGIYTSGGIIMEGPKFRQLTKTQMDQVIPRLQVLARSSPEDKRILVRRLKELGETVAVTGDGTNDGPALKMADVGFSMGIAGTEVAKEASSIILMDDNFSSIVKALMWGRAVNDAVKKFLQVCKPPLSSINMC
jgi:Ca2+-transporting ATPase